jgi:general secretion pathway protein G
MNRFPKPRRTRRGFTLIELLLVLVILAVLAAVVIPKMTGRVEDSKKSATMATISNLKSALEAFEIDNGHYPSSQEGLDALVNKPASAGENWTHKYIDEVPRDGWNQEFTYLGPDSAPPGMDFDIISNGGDLQYGTTDDINTQQRK